MAGLLEGKNLLLTGVITTSSIAFHVARLAQEEGANVVLTGYGRMSLVERISARLPTPAPVVELDVANPEQLASLADSVREHVPHLDGVLHSIGFAPQAALGGNFLNTEWEDVATALHISTYSLKSLAVAARPLFNPAGVSIVGLTLDATIAWPLYDWMGVAKAGFESANRYLAMLLGPENVRCNLIAAGPIRTLAAKSIPGFEQFDMWDERAPLGWDLSDPEPAARGCVGLMSDWFPKTTGEIIHVDGGVHAVGG